jgi:hypothetical protein
MARKSIVLLKNNKILPLKKTINKIAVIGPNADNAGMLWGYIFIFILFLLFYFSFIYFSFFFFFFIFHLFVCFYFILLFSDIIIINLLNYKK